MAFRSIPLALALAVSAVTAGAFIAPTAAVAQKAKAGKAAGGSMKGLLGNASDSALDQLSRPGAFYADQAVRILLPGPLQKATKLMKLTDKAGLTNNLTRSINDAAGLAAQEAKPVFRSAIDSMTLTDGVGIVTGGDTGGTQYLRRTSGDVLRQKMRPLVSDALGKTGALKQLDSLGRGGGTGSMLGALAGVDLSRDGLIDSVTDQAMSGIFTYIGREESNFRKNPLKAGQKLLDAVTGK
ncbi:MAG: DUF4197 domain-containing protein [Blastomonas fulva]|uniref:DUF4197 domain-containing protein n=1 Tax=Blastomonas fulva TaxID=1550728 RepID=UPI0025A43364|nr:DUF4197 domain-containing protein [Blastomonas fulva]MDM7929899.1 DUF4197 domain-containing protein [Blastomonas fulva]MDM7966860.1 DUF4197 domain-containing protein [Blastomonas fulva]